MNYSEFIGGRDSSSFLMTFFWCLNPKLVFKSSDPELRGETLAPGLLMLPLERPSGVDCPHLCKGRCFGKGVRGRRQRILCSAEMPSWGGNTFTLFIVLGKELGSLHMHLIFLTLGEMILFPSLYVGEN